MGMSVEEFEKQRNDLSLRFYIDEQEDEDFGWVVRDRTTGEIVGEDGGEPEDQLLVRDWQWVASALNAVEEERRALAAEVERLRPYEEAVRRAHNGYDPEMREQFGMKGPESPKEAIRELIEEAEALGRQQAR